MASGPCRSDSRDASFETAEAARELAGSFAPAGTTPSTGVTRSRRFLPRGGFPGRCAHASVPDPRPSTVSPISPSSRRRWGHAPGSMSVTMPGPVDKLISTGPSDAPDISTPRCPRPLCVIAFTSLRSGTVLSPLGRGFRLPAFHRILSECPPDPLDGLFDHPAKKLIRRSPPITRKTVHRVCGRDRETLGPARLPSSTGPRISPSHFRTHVHRKRSHRLLVRGRSNEWRRAVERR